MQAANQLDLDSQTDKIDDPVDQLKTVNSTVEEPLSYSSNKRDDTRSNGFDKSFNISNTENDLKPINDSVKKPNLNVEVSLFSGAANPDTKIEASPSPKTSPAAIASQNAPNDVVNLKFGDAEVPFPQISPVSFFSQNIPHDAVENRSSKATPSSDSSQNTRNDATENQNSASNERSSPSRRGLETEESPKQISQVDDLRRRGRAFFQGIVDNFTAQSVNRPTSGDSEGQSIQREMQIKEDRITWKQLLQNWANKTEIPTQRKLRNMCWRGIPSSCRGEAWFAIIGNDLKITKDLYKILLSRAKTTTIDASSKEDSANLIEVDAPRTFPELKFFHGDGPLRGPLINILKTYVSFRPDVGYIQGMSYIAAMLLLNLDDECNAFISLANLLNRELYFTLFRDFQSGRAHLNVFDKLLQKHVPRCAQKFKDLQLTSDMYLYDWILTIFSRSFPLDIACRIWDCFLVYGQVFMFRAALGVLKMYERAFLQSNFEQCLHLLNKIPRNMDENVLFQSIQSISISDKSLNAILSKVQTVS